MGSLALSAEGFDPLEQSISLPQFPPRRRDQSSGTPQSSALSTATEDVSVFNVESRKYLL